MRSEKLFYSIILLGTALFTAILVVSVNLYIRHAPTNMKPYEMPGQVLHILNDARKTPLYHLQNRARNQTTGNITTSITQKKPKHYTQIVPYDPKTIRNLVTNLPYNSKLSMPIDHGYWINVTTHKAQDTGLTTTTYTIFWIILACLFVYFIYTCLSYFLKPLKKLNARSLAFAKDFQNQPIETQGPSYLKQTLTAFNRLQTTYTNLMSNRTQMLAAISHDLRTPLTRLKLRAESIEPNTTADKMLKDITEMDNMLDSVLVFAKHDYQNETINTLNLDALLTAICDDLSDLGKPITYQSPNKNVTIKGRMNALKRAFSNIMDNAIKYGKTAEVSLHFEKQHAIIEVADKGPGIEEAEREKVFLPFYRINKARTEGQGSTGLGLAIVAEIIKLHLGQITLNNAKTHSGLVVQIWLPLAH